MRSLIQPRFQVPDIVRTALQRVGAHAVDRAVWHLGLGRQGIRLTGASLAQNTDRWEAEVHGWKASIVAEAAELITHRALSAVFDLNGGESVAVESMTIRWLPSGVRSSGDIDSGKLFLEWSLLEREEFRREVLANLTTGAVASFTVVGCDREGLGVVHVELEVRASTRLQISGVKK